MHNHNIQPLLNKTYKKAVRASGVYIYDEKGKAYLDGSSGAITCSLGHSHPRLISCLKKQLDKLQYVYRSQFGSEEAEHLAELLFKKSPGKYFQSSFFVNSGSEAMETAMKVAIQYWQELGLNSKKHFITRRKSYHGITMGALSLSGHPNRRGRFEDSLHKYATLGSDIESMPLEQQLEEFEQQIEFIGSSNIAAFVAEPIVGAAGTALTPMPGYYQHIREICNQHQILFIADEVMTGIGRTGKWFALEHWSTLADLVVVGKSLGAGYAPIAAVLVPQSILEPIKKGSGIIMSGHTYSGHPLSCAAACEVIEVIEEDKLIQKVANIGKKLKKVLTLQAPNYEFISKVRGKGLLLGIEFDPGLKNLQNRCIDYCFESGLLVYPSAGGQRGECDNGILITPPFIISEEQIDELLGKLFISFDRINRNS